MKRWLAVAAVLVLVLVVGRTCTRRGEPEGGRATADVALQDTMHAVDRPAAAGAAPEPAPSGERIAAMMAAADVVQQYLQAAGAGRFDEADDLWVGRHVPDARDEGGLRSLLPSRSLHIRSDSPVSADRPSSAPPSRMRVPVQLRLTGTDGRIYRYSGDYTVQRDPGTRAWRLSKASLQAAIDGR